MGGRELGGERIWGRGVGEQIGGLEREVGMGLGAG